MRIHWEELSRNNIIVGRTYLQTLCNYIRLWRKNSSSNAVEFCQLELSKCQIHRLHHHRFSPQWVSLVCHHSFPQIQLELDRSSYWAVYCFFCNSWNNRVREIFQFGVIANSKINQKRANDHVLHSTEAQFSTNKRLK